MKRLVMINSDGKSAPVTPDPADVTTELVDLRRRVFARTPARRILTDLLTLDAAENALEAGADGIYVDSFADYGVHAIRGVTDRPVVGAGEAALAEAVRLETFAVVTVWPASLGFLYDERLAAVPGATSACLGVHHYSPEDELDLVGTGTSVRARMVRHEDDLVADLIRTCQWVQQPRGYVRQCGTTGPWLVLFHESPLSSEVWKRVMPLLEPDLRVIAFDTPGYVVLSGVALYDDEERAEHLAHWAPDTAQDLQGSQFDWAVERYQRIWPGLDEEMLHLATVEALRVLPRYHWGYRAAFRHDPSGPLAALDVPVLLLDAEHDLLADKDARALELAKEARLEILPDFPGQPHLRAPAAYAAHLLEFVREVTA